MKKKVEKCVPLQILKKYQKGEAVMIDVRSHEEFFHGHINSATNIPFEMLEASIKNIKAWKKPILVCSSTGERSQKACTLLNLNGIDAYDCGKWEEFNQVFSSIESSDKIDKKVHSSYSQRNLGDYFR